MPYHTLALTSRRHPISIGFYVAMLIISFLNITGLATSNTMAIAVGIHVQRLWAAFLFLGCSLALISVLLPNRKLFFALRLEALGTFVICMELLAYCTVIYSEIRPLPLTSFTTYSCLSVACLWRARSALSDRRRVLKTVAALHPSSSEKRGDDQS